MSVEIHVSVDGGGGDQLPDGPDPAEDPAGDLGGEVEEDSLRCGVSVVGASQETA